MHTKIYMWFTILVLIRLYTSTNVPNLLNQAKVQYLLDK